MRHFRIGVLALVAMTGAAPVALAQTRVAPPTAVESTPLAPPPGVAVPAQVPVPAQTPPAAVPEIPAGPQPVQPAPAPQGPVTPTPVQPAPLPQVPLEPQPVQPPPRLPQPGETPPVAPQQQTGIPNPDATMAGKRGDTSDVDEVLLVPKPVLMISGQSSWDDGFQRLSQTFRMLREEAARAGLPVAGRPLTLFVSTDDNGFRYDAMLPVAPVAGGPAPAFGNGVRLGASPAGPSLRFLHVAPYDDIDSTYETITAYLEAKSIVVKDAFLEEYVSDLNDPADPNLEINVYVQPK